MNAHAYSEYRAVPDESLRRLPSHWSATRVRFLLRDGPAGIKIGPFGSALRLEDMVDEGFKVFGQENVIYNDFRAGKRYISAEKFDSMRVYEVISDDILITMMGTSGKCRIVPKDIQEGIIDSHLLRMRTNALVEPRFFELLLNESHPLQQQIEVAGKGSIMHGLNSGIVKDLLLPVPTKPEQAAIVNYLDRETAKIDTLIDQQEQLIKLLEEKRQAVISHAVTKGLNPDARMKDSGVEWLGEVPEHWEVRRLGAYGRFVAGCGFPHEFQGQDSGEYPFFKVSDTNNVGNEVYLVASNNYVSKEVAAVLGAKIAPCGGIMFPKVGAALLGNKRRILMADSITDNNTMVFVPFEGDSKYWYYWLREIDLGQISNPGPVPSVNESQLRDLVAVLPPKDEREAIVRHLDAVLQSSSAVIAQAEVAVSLLRERRTSLISAAVTGKIDVRNVA